MMKSVTRVLKSVSKIFWATIYIFNVMLCHCFCYKNTYLFFQLPQVSSVNYDRISNSSTDSYNSENESPIFDNPVLPTSSMQHT